MIEATMASRRLPREIARLSDLSGQGIYYKQDENSLHKGLAMILGPQDSVYANCFLFFKFEFPHDYPFNPPKIEFLTNDGATRFHPNLYTDGKVCLSILGTFAGPGWQSTMSLSMVLLSLKALLDTNPLRHEPGYENISLSHKYALEYKEYVHHQIIKTAILECKHKTYLRHFEDHICHLLPVMKRALRYEIVAQLQVCPQKTYTYIPYGMVGATNWNTLLSIIDGT
jgi:ubiquitin-conjugating enzyme E2 Z